MRRLIGRLLLGIGILFAALGGMCTFGMSISEIDGVLKGRAADGGLPFLALSAITVLIGLGLIFAGKHIAGPASDDTPEN